ncbi:class I adenylate-forming enzyme family protein [Chloroflexota bacterium]
MTIAEMLARSARMYPNDSALIELKPGKKIRREITWKEFDERANRVANALIARGVGKGDKVVHLMMNSINWLEAYFGIIRTGAWAVPLNFRFTGRDIKYCANIAEGKVMILSEEFTQRVEDIRSQLPTIKDYIFVGHNPPEAMESFEDVISGVSSRPVDIELRDEEPCGLYFTSGTTGAPKPIILTHKNMECAAITENRHHHQTHEDNFILLPPLYHTGAKMHWFGSLIVGSRATILTEISPRYIFEAVHQERGTVVWLLVPWAHDIVRAIDSGELRKEDYDLSCWRLMHMGAQPIPPSLIRHWKEHFPNIQYDTSYGLSESTGPGCIDLGMENGHKIEATGKAGFNWEVRIVDDSGNDVASSEIGEIVVRGNGVMKGYYKNPEKTAETIKDGWLYTDDMARMDEEGFIYVIDRKKDVINRGGENIFPVEVEQALLSHPKIYDVAVIGFPDERLGEMVGAVIELKPHETLTEREVNAFCEHNLPRYKRPQHIIFDKVLRNPTGKIEKARMRQKYADSQESFRV